MAEHRRPAWPGRATATPTAPPRPPSTLSPLTRDLDKSDDHVRVLLPPLPRSQNPPPSNTSNNALSSSISLSSPRPDVERRENFYVEAPLMRSPLLSPTASAASPPKSPSVILRPPSKSETSSSPSSSSPRSIICRECGRCKCAACRVRRRLPESWLCGGQVRVSPDSMVDCLSCMSLVKALAYHCSKDRQRQEERRKSYQWLIMGFASFTCLLPCLWCYWPLRGCVKGAEFVYQERTSNSCRCDDDKSEGGENNNNNNNNHHVGVDERNKQDDVLYQGIRGISTLS